MKLIKKVIKFGAEDFITFTVVGRNGYHRWFSVASRLIAKDYQPGRRYVAHLVHKAREEVRHSAPQRYPIAPSEKTAL